MQDLHAVVGTAHPHAPVGAERDRQQVDQLVERGGRVLGERLHGLEVEEQVAPGGVPGDPDHLDALELVAGGDDRVRHHAGRGLEQHVVDGGPVGAVLDDLDRLDVAAGLTDRGRDAPSDPGTSGSSTRSRNGIGSAPLEVGASPVRTGPAS